MNKYPPMFPGASEPHIIIGVNLISDFTEHYSLVKDCQSPEQFGVSVKPIPAKIRDEIGKAYLRLRESGWYPNGFDEHKRINWFYAIDSRPKELRDMGGVEYSKEECNMARARVNAKINRSSPVNGMAKCEPWDFNNHGDNGR